MRYDLKADLANVSLAPEAGHKIVGFFGSSGSYGMCNEFGIVTVEKDVELPDSAYEFLEKQTGQKRRKTGREDENVS